MNYINKIMISLIILCCIGANAQINDPQIYYLENNSAIINYLDNSNYLIQSQFIDNISHTHFFNNTSNNSDGSENYGDEIVIKNVTFPTDDHGIRPYDYCFNPVNHKYYMYGGDYILVYNSQTNEQIAKLDISNTSDIKPIHIYPNYKSILYNESTNKIYCVTPDNTFVIIDGETNEKDPPISLGTYDDNVFRSIYFDHINTKILIAVNIHPYDSPVYSKLWSFSLDGVLEAEQDYNFRIDDIEPISNNKLYSATTQGIFKVNPNDLSEYTLIDSGKPSELIYAVNENKIYSSSYFTQELIIINVITEDVETVSLDVPLVITESVYNPINKKVYLSGFCFEFATSHLLIISTENDNILQQFELDHFWGGILWEEMNGYDNRMYFSDSEKLYSMLGSGNTITSEIDQHAGDTRNLGYNPDLSQVITLKTDKAYFVINNSSLNNIINVTTTGGWCETSAYDPINDKIYITDNKSINEKVSLSIYDGTDFSLIESLGADFSPINIHYSDVTEETYILTEDGKIKIINGVNNTIQQTLLLGGNHSLNILTSNNDKLFTASYSPDMISCFDLQNNNRTDLNISTGKPTKLVFGDQDIIYVNSGIGYEQKHLHCIHILDNIEWSVLRDFKDFLVYSPIDQSVFIQKDNNITKIDGHFGSIISSLSLGDKNLIDGIYNAMDNTMLLIIEDSDYYLWKLNCDDLSFYQAPVKIPNGMYNNLFINILNNRLYLYLAFESSDFKTKLLSYDPGSLQQLSITKLGPQRCLTDLFSWSAPEKIKPCLNPTTNQLILPNWAYSNFSIVQCPEEERTLNKGWNWVSFPKLDRTDDNPVDLAPLLNTLETMPENILVQHRLNTATNPMTDAEYDEGQWTFNNLDELQSTKGYKIEMDDTNENEFQLITAGTRLDPDYPIMLKGNMVENWIGYYEYQQADPFDALAYCIDNLRWIKGQYWSAHYEVLAIDKGAPVYGWMMSRPRPLKYGDMLVVQGIDDCELIWNQEPEPGGKALPETEYFEYEEQADYTSVFIELDENTQAEEIGAFVGETCVGATVVEEGDTLVEIQTYLQGIEGEEMNFVTYNGNKASDAIPQDYLVKDFKNMQYVKRKIRPYDQKPFHLISFKNKTTESNEKMLVYHFPNPAIDELNIHFNLIADQKVSIQLMDISGKVMDKLDLGHFTKGMHKYQYSIPQNLSSGVYLYKFITKQTTIVNQLIIQ